MQQYVALNLEYNTEQFTYYSKLRAELRSNIQNTTTLYYNHLPETVEFDKAGGDGGEN